MEYYLNKYEQKMLKLQTKAQECVSREKAQKIIRKSDKWSLKNNINLTSHILIENDSQYPLGPPSKAEIPLGARRLAPFNEG